MLVLNQLVSGNIPTKMVNISDQWSQTCTLLCEFTPQSLNKPIIAKTGVHVMDCVYFDYLMKTATQQHTRLKF